MLAIAATVMMTAGAGIMVSAAPASADQVWTQSFERASADAPCTAPADETPWQEGWVEADKEWKPTWEQWPNGGKGGYTCTRSITWALDTVATPFAFCVQGSSNEWVNFNGGYSLPFGAPVYGLADCSGFTSQAGFDIVYAPSPFDPATLCLEAFGTAEYLVDFGYDVWTCRAYFI